MQASRVFAPHATHLLGQLVAKLVLLLHPGNREKRQARGREARRECDDRRDRQHADEYCRHPHPLARARGAGRGLHPHCRRLFDTKNEHLVHNFKKLATEFQAATTRRSHVNPL
jgi:hypothetical protein